jgi:hypothetical protein
MSNTKFFSNNYNVLKVKGRSIDQAHFANYSWQKLRLIGGKIT